jgi:glyoxylase-like metal-dependent hydrolase (beta-lactamase superfamily II)
MTTLIEVTTLDAGCGTLDAGGVDEAAARASLRAQIARVESDLPFGPGHDNGRGARIQTLEELERIRDDLVRRIQERRFDQGEEQERKRRLREEMLLDPAAHRGTTVSNEEVGEPGCNRWTNWFRLKISGGCP